MEFSERFKQSSCKSRNFVFLKKGKHIKSPYKKIIFFAAFCVLTLLLYYSGIGCVWRYFLHIPCPGCGMTRASIMLLKGDFTLFSAGNGEEPGKITATRKGSSGYTLTRYYYTGVVTCDDTTGGSGASVSGICASLGVTNQTTGS